MPASSFSGEGELREHLERQIREYHLEKHVLLPGFRIDVLGCIKSFDVFAMSSVTEGLGTSLLDAMACSRAIVATRTGGIPEVVEDGVTGILSAPRDHAAMAQAIVRLLGTRRPVHAWAPPASRACRPTSRSSGWWHKPPPYTLAWPAAATRQASRRPTESNLRERRRTSME